MTTTSTVFLPDASSVMARSGVHSLPSTVIFAPVCAAGGVISTLTLPVLSTGAGGAAATTVALPAPLPVAAGAAEPAPAPEPVVATAGTAEPAALPVAAGAAEPVALPVALPVAAGGGVATGAGAGSIFFAVPSAAVGVFNTSGTSSDFATGPVVEANAPSVPVPSPNRSPQNTPTARPADITTGTALDVPRRTGFGGGAAACGWPIGGMPGYGGCPLPACGCMPI